MFKFIKSTNSGNAFPEPITIKKSIYDTMYAHSVYFLSAGNFSEICDTSDAFIFIPLADAPHGTDRVIGYFVSEDMLFEADYTIAGEEDEGSLGSPLFFEHGPKGNSGVSSQNVSSNFYGGAYLINNDDIYTRGKAIVILKMANEPIN